MPCAKTTSKLNKFLDSEVNLLIQHIIVQDQDGQNSNRKIRIRSRGKESTEVWITQQ